MKLAYEEIIDFLASAPTPERILKHKASSRVQSRVADLVQGRENSTLDSEEKDELGTFLQLEHIMRVAKAKAAMRLKRGTKS